MKRCIIPFNTINHSPTVDYYNIVCLNNAMSSMIEGYDSLRKILFKKFTFQSFNRHHFLSYFGADRSAEFQFKNIKTAT